MKEIARVQKKQSLLTTSPYKVRAILGMSESNFLRLWGCCDGFAG